MQVRLHRYPAPGGEAREPWLAQVVTRHADGSCTLHVTIPGQPVAIAVARQGDGEPGTWTPVDPPPTTPPPPDHPATRRRALPEVAAMSAHSLKGRPQKGLDERQAAKFMGQLRDAAEDAGVGQVPTGKCCGTCKHWVPDRRSDTFGQCMANVFRDCRWVGFPKWIEVPPASRKATKLEGASE